MNSAIAPYEPTPESKSQRFEFGYEKESKDSRSVQRTRADFLIIVLDKRPNIVFDLFTRTHQPFIELLRSNATSIDQISRAIQEEIPETSYSLREPIVNPNTFEDSLSENSCRIGTRFN